MIGGLGVVCVGEIIDCGVFQFWVGLQRYIAMFTLRNLDAVHELAHVLSVDTCSAALRHEIAFILGQMEFTSENGQGGHGSTGGADGQGEAGAGAHAGAHENVAVSALVRNLRNTQEHAMVRHESAIALGSLGGDVAKAALAGGCSEIACYQSRNIAWNDTTYRVRGGASAHHALC